MSICVNAATLGEVPGPGQADEQAGSAFPVDTGSSTVITADLADRDALREAVRGVDAVLHLAGISLESTFDKILRANIEGTYNLYEAAREEGVRRIVFASSNHAVGFTPRPQG